METINDRIEMIVKEQFNGNKSAFASALGMGPTIMSSYLSEKRRSKPSVDMIAKIVKVLGVDAKWLLIGETTERNHVSTQGDHSPASIHGDAINTSGEVELLQQRVRLLETLIAEKERLIKVLLDSRNKTE